MSIDEGPKSALMAALLLPETEIKGQFIWSNYQLVDWLTGPGPDIQ